MATLPWAPVVLNSRANARVGPTWDHAQSWKAENERSE